MQYYLEFSKLNMSFYFEITTLILNFLDYYGSQQIKPFWARKKAKPNSVKWIFLTYDG